MTSVNFLPVTIETAEYRISGKVALPSVGQIRLSDYANDPSRHFFSVIDVTLSSRVDPKQTSEREFVLVARNQVHILMPNRAPETD